MDLKDALDIQPGDKVTIDGEEFMVGDAVSPQDIQARMDLVLTAFEASKLKMDHITLAALIVLTDGLRRFFASHGVTVADANQIQPSIPTPKGRMH